MGLEENSLRGPSTSGSVVAESGDPYGTGETFPHDAAEGFIRITLLETELHVARARALSRA